jgi:hypothetical protein
VKRGSERGEVKSLLLGALVAAVAIGAFFEWRRREQVDRLQREQLAKLELDLDRLRAEHRTLASLLALREPPSPAPARAPSASSPASSLAAKPLGEAPDADERARRIGDDPLARALEKAAVMPTPEELVAPVPELVADATQPSGEKSPTSETATPAGSKPEEPAPAAPDHAPLFAAVNQLLQDAGLDGWHLLSATPLPDERALGTVVLAHRTEQGTAIGSLAAERMLLERDVVSGVAEFVFAGAKGTEGGVDVAYEGATTRLPIPGILPLDLLAPELRRLFGLGEAGDKPAVTATGEQVVRSINEVLAREKNVGLRLRSVDRLEESKLKKAVIDLAFDERGEPTQTVLADEAWFEVDPVARYGELCCEGGDMVEKGQKRPLFRGKLRLPLRDIKPEQWKAVPSARLAAGS